MIEKMNKWFPYQEWWRDWPCETTATCIKTIYAKVPNPAGSFPGDKERENKKIINLFQAITGRGFFVPCEYYSTVKINVTKSGV